MIKTKRIAFLALLVFALSIFPPMGSSAEKPAARGPVSDGKLSFTLNDADIRSVLPIFAKVLKVNIIAGDDVSGNISLSFSNVVPLEGFEAVMRSKGLDWNQEGNTIVVSSKKQVRTYVLEFAPAKDVSSALSLLADNGDSISVNEAYNALMIKASSDNMQRIEKALKELDVPPLQVMVEAKIVEIQAGDGGAAGVDFKYTKPGNPNDVVQTIGLSGKPTSTTDLSTTLTDTSALGMYAQIISTNIEAYLSAVESVSGYNVVAAPRLCALNHKEASILIGSKIGYKTAVITDTGTVQQINYLDTGTNLVFTPHISENGYIRMEIAPKISESLAAGDVPSENTTETKNEVLVKDGQTIVIGGLIKHSEKQVDTGIPLLMRIPFLGALFRSTEILNEKKELMIFVTPHIMTPEYLDQMEKDRQKFLDQEQREGSSFYH